MTSHSNEHDDKCMWTNKNEGIFIRLLHDHVTKGDLQTSTFSRKTWSTIEVELFTETNHRFTTPQLKSKYNRLRKKFREFSDLITKSGFGWNSDTNTVTASDDVWDEYLKKKPSAKQFRRRGLDHYDALSVIFSSTTATGSWRFSSRQMPPTAEEDHSVEDNFDDDDGQEQDEDVDSDQVVRTLRSKGKGKRCKHCSTHSDPPTKKKKDDNMESLLLCASDYYRSKASRNSKSAQSATSPKPKDSVDECMAICEAMGDIPADTYIKFLNVLADRPIWRQMFLNMTDTRRREWLASL